MNFLNCSSIKAPHLLPKSLSRLLQGLSVLKASFSFLIPTASFVRKFRHLLHLWWPLPPSDTAGWGPSGLGIYLYCVAGPSSGRQLSHVTSPVMVHPLGFLIKHEWLRLWLPLLRQPLGPGGITHCNGSATHCQAARQLLQAFPELDPGSRAEGSGGAEWRLLRMVSSWHTDP